MIKILADSESRVLGRSNGERLDVQTFVTLPKLHPNFNHQSAILN